MTTSEFPVVYASSRAGYAVLDTDDEKRDLEPLFKTIISHVPAPAGEEDGPLQILVSNVDYDDYVGRIAIGRIDRGRISTGQQAAVCKKDGTVYRSKISRMCVFEGLKRTECEDAGAGDIVAVSGISDINIGETICDAEVPEPLPFVDIDEPTVSMTFSVNDSPFAGKEGHMSSRHLRTTQGTEQTSLRRGNRQSDSFIVSGREHLSILSKR